MISVTLVSLSDALPSCLYAWEDLFSYANRLSLRRGGPEVFVTQRWNPVEVPLEQPNIALLPVRMAGGLVGREVGPSPDGLSGVLRRWAASGTVMGAACVGVFCLAEAGLLDGRRATTHWSMTEEFRRRFPRVILDTDAMVIEDDSTVLGGGMTAYFDVALRLIRRYAGAEVAQDCAAVFLLDPDRRHQSPFVPTDVVSHEGDPILARAMEWVWAQSTLDFGVADWAAAVGLEKRTLERRAQAAWGWGPAERLRRVRLDRARMLVAGGTLPWNQVAARCGYRDPAALRRLFLERFGQTPGEYHRRFGRG